MDDSPIKDGKRRNILRNTDKHSAYFPNIPGTPPTVRNMIDDSATQKYLRFTIFSRGGPMYTGYPTRSETSNDDDDLMTRETGLKRLFFFRNKELRGLYLLFKFSRVSSLVRNKISFPASYFRLVSTKNVDSGVHFGLGIIFPSSTITTVST